MRGISIGFGIGIKYQNTLHKGGGGVVPPAPEQPNLLLWDNGTEVLWDNEKPVELFKIPDAIRKSMVVWYDVAKQNATNESMQANPVLKDFSGNGRDATCYNFAWSGMSGIGGLYFDNFHSLAHNIYTFTTNESKSFAHITSINSSAFWLYLKTIAVGDEINYKIRITGLDSLRNNYPNCDFCVTNSSTNVSFRQIYKSDGEYECNAIVQEGDYLSAGLGIYDLFQRTDYPVNCDIVIEQLPQYPGALVYDGVDDYAMYTKSLEDVQFPGYTMIYKAIVFRDKQYGNHFTLNGKGVQIATVGNYLASKVERNNSYGKRTDFPEKPEYYNTVRTVYQSTYSFDGIQDLGAFEENIPAIGTDHDGIRLGSALGNGSVSKIVLYSFILFNRDLTPAEIAWVKTNLIEQ